MHVRTLPAITCSKLTIETKILNFKNFMAAFYGWVQLPQGYLVTTRQFKCRLDTYRTDGSCFIGHYDYNRGLKNMKKCSLKKYLVTVLL